jgi:ABC-2 type transport system permease protein
MKALCATAFYEMRMVTRTRLLWFSVAPVVLLSLLLALTSDNVIGLDDPVARVGAAAVLMNTFCGIGLAATTADRLRGHRLTGLADLLETTPTGAGARLFGVVAGAAAVTLAPLASGLLIFAVVAGISSASVAPAWAALAATAVVLLPSVLVVVAISTAIGLVLPAALARTLAVGLWLWATLVSDRLLPIPAVSGTILSPAGGYPAVSWLHAPRSLAVVGSGSALSPPPGTWPAIANLAAMAAFAILCIVMARLIDHYGKTRTP